MPCDRTLKPKQTIQQRATEVREVVARISRGLAAGSIKVKIGPQGAVAFLGITDAERDNVTDACAYRRLIASASPIAMQAIARAEALAGRSVDKQVVAAGGHYHGDVYHTHKG